MTALYDIQPSLQRSDGESLGTLSIRFKQPDGDTSQLVVGQLPPGDDLLASASTDFRFATAVAAFGMLLRGSQHVGKYSLEDVAALAAGALGDDLEGERSGFVALVCFEFR